MKTAPSARKPQFLFEQQLRRRILDSPPDERAAVVAAAYDELFAKFPDHAVFELTDDDRAAIARRGADLFGPLSKPGDRVLEVGCGQGLVIHELARRGRECHGIEPSHQMAENAKAAQTVKITFGLADKLEFPDSFFDLVFSQQVLEHIHPDDVPIHFKEAYRVIKPEGIFALETPNKHTGPQDVSRGFTKEAEGLHLKEWTIAETIVELRRAGFEKIRALSLPPFIARRSETLHRMSWIPARCKHLEDLLLAAVPGLGPRTFLGRALGLNDVFLFGRKPK